MTPLQHDEMPICSFCGKRGDEVSKIIAGPNVNICDECVDLCSEIVAKGRAHKTVKRPQTPRTGRSASRMRRVGKPAR